MTDDKFYTTSDGAHPPIAILRSDHPEKDVAALAYVMERPHTTYELLIQDEWWCTKEGAWVKLEDMTPAHCRNTLRMLERHRETLASAVYLQSATYWSAAIGSLHGDMATYYAEQEADDEADRMLSDPEGWFDDCPLIRKLRSLVPPDPTLMETMDY